VIYYSKQSVYLPQGLEHLFT